jgi:hypothetical protein
MSESKTWDHPPHVAAFQVQEALGAHEGGTWWRLGLDDTKMLGARVGEQEQLLTASSLLIFARSQPSSRRRTNRRPLDEEGQVGESTIKLRPRMLRARRVHDSITHIDDRD